MELAVLGLVALAPLSARALGIRIPDQDTLATARGNAFAATADNPSAIYYNPAGITQLDGLQARSGLYTIYLKSEFESPAGFETDTFNRVLPVPHFFYTYTPGDSAVSYGLGIYSPFGLGLDWPDNPVFGRRKGKLTDVTINPVVAWEICPGLSIGAGPQINYSRVELRQIAGPGELSFKGDDIRYGFNAGLMWQPHRQHSFGINYRSATTARYRGETKFEGVYARQGSAADFDFPQTVVVGWSFRPTPKWNIEFNVDWTDWDTVDVVTLDKRSPVPISLAFNWSSSFMYEWGATRYFDNGYWASAGYIFSENSVPDADFTPSVPDSDRHVFSLGVGRRYSKLWWDLAYQFAWGPARSVEGLNPAFRGDYTFISHALALSIGYAF